MLRKLVAAVVLALFLADAYVLVSRGSAPEASLSAHVERRPHRGSTISQVPLATNMGTYYGTYQSDNSRAAYVPNGGGIFVSYLARWVNDNSCGVSAPQPASGSADGCPNTLNVDRSTDGGLTFSHVLQINVGGHDPASIEADSAGDVIVVMNDGGSPNGAWVYKLPAGNWTSPQLMGELPFGYDDKFSSAYNPAGQSASNGGTWWELHGGNGPTSGHYEIFVNRAAANGWGGGPVSTQCTSGTQQNCYLGMVDDDSGALAPAGGVYGDYPELYFDRSSSCPSGQSGSCDLTLMAWTTSNPNNPKGYYDIHYIISPDGGQTWYGKTGAISSWPILAGDDGVGWQLLDASEYNSGANTYTNDTNWLANIYVQDGHLYFIYRHQGSYALYRRVTPRWTGSGYTMTNDVGPVTVGLADGNGAFFSGNGTTGSQIFLTSDAPGGTSIKTVSSTNDGQTWNTYATSPPTATSVYATSGGHDLGPGGTIIGAYTDEIGTNGAHSNLYFIHNP
jgi:hypothetical protein